MKRRELLRRGGAVAVPAALAPGLLSAQAPDYPRAGAIIRYSPLVEERARAQGFRVDARPTDSFAPFLEAEIQRWSGVIKGADIRAD
jgi:hypothetical protein